MSRVLNLLLTHQAASATERMLAWWRDYAAPEDVLIAFNGDRAVFEAIPHPQKIQIDDPRLCTVRHTHERQSYTGVVQAASQWLEGRNFTHVHFAEYDHVPLVPDLNRRQLARLAEEGADVLAFHLAQVDGTNRPHLLYHASLPEFFPYWKQISVRRDQGVIFSMLGTGSFWTREAFDAVASRAEPFPIYLELYLPTLAHHLGYRVRDWREQNRFVKNLGEFSARIESARWEGAWTLHPVKMLWTPSIH